MPKETQPRRGKQAAAAPYDKAGKAPAKKAATPAKGGKSAAPAKGKAAVPAKGGKAAVPAKGGKAAVPAKGSKGAAAAKKAAAEVAKKRNSHLFEKRPRNFGIGQDIQPKRDLTRFVRWPKYIRMQRQKRVLMHRLKVPPTIAQFTRTLDKNLAKNLFSFLDKYKPETRSQKVERLRERAKLVAGLKEGEQAPALEKPLFVKYGLNHVTSLIESKKAKLVVIAHDVDPIELVVWLPALCKKVGVPYCIVKSKSRLGQVVHKKTSAVLAITNVKKEDQPSLAVLTKAIQENFNDRFEEFKKMRGGLQLGRKSLAKQKAKAKAAALLK